MEGLNQNERKRKWVSNVRKLAVIRLRQCRKLYLELGNCRFALLFSSQQFLGSEAIIY